VPVGRDRVLAVFFMGKISKKGIMKEGKTLPSQRSKIFLLLYQNIEKVQHFFYFFFKIL
jgi:hypothetical protein